MRLRVICLFLALFQAAGCGMEVSVVPAGRATPMSSEGAEITRHHTGTLDPRAIEQLRATARRLKAGTVVLGTRRAADNGPYDFGGSGFVVSAKRRLIATAAHVADHFSGEDELVAVADGTLATHLVRRVWYHPGLIRTLDGGLFARSDDPLDGETAYGGPDVAVIQLSDDGPELTAQVQLADAKELENLQGKTVGFLGYPVRTDDRSPSPSRAAAATFSACVIGQMVDVWHLLDTPASPGRPTGPICLPRSSSVTPGRRFPTRIVVSVCIQPGMKHVYSTWSVESMSPV